MSDFSTNLQLPYLMPAQAQKHVTVNESLRRLDALCQANAVSMSVTAEPASPADGDLYIVPAGKTGAGWADAADWSLAVWADGAWILIAPREGWLVWVKDDAQLVRWTGADWVQVDIVTLGTVQAALANGGALGDPGADRILFWDDSENGFRCLAPSANLSISGSALDVGANVLLESECSSAASVKAINQGLATSNDVRFETLGVGVSAVPATTKLYLAQSNSALEVIRAFNTSGAHAAPVARLQSARAANPAYSFLMGESGVGGSADTEFLLRGDGNGLCDGSWTGGGADYAEYFEWEDGNPDGDDRRGVAVVLAGARIRPAAMEDDPASIIGAVSGNPSVVGDAAWNRWSEKYLRDDFAACLMEDAPDGEGSGEVTQRRRLNPAFDPARPYVPRAERPEWDAVGLVGKLRLRKGQPVGARWIRLREISPAVEEWLVR